MTRILLIEDDPYFRQVLHLGLSQAGYSVAEATDGADGLLQLRLQPADVVITDLLMPQMDGIETIRYLRRGFPAVKIIAISGGGLGDAEYYLKIAQELGAGKILKKPFSVRELLEAIEELHPSSA
jgi:CheY-like chemotaxis protein